MIKEFKDIQKLYNSIEDLEMLFHNSNSNGGVIEWDEFSTVVKNVIDKYNDLKKEEN